MKLKETLLHSETLQAIIVTYHPKLEALHALCDRLLPQVASIVVVDNGSGPVLPAFLATRQDDPIHGICLARNTGVAHALNVGIQWAREAGATMVLTFDQDSLPAPDMVAVLLAAHAQLTREGVRVGALGPLQIDRRSHLPTPFPVISGDAFKRVLPAPGELLEVEHLITSGCLTSLAVLEAVGPMRAELFIDGIDLEWSWRCRAAGFRLYGVERAQLLHAIGDRIVSFLGHQLHLHSPLRQYYILRNMLYLRTLPHSPLSWGRTCWRRILRRLVFFSLFFPPRPRYFRLMLRGIKDGLAGRLGPAEKL